MIEKALIADDEPLMLQFMATVLTRKGIEVVLAENGQQAIRMLETQSFDLVISDIRMPIKSGLDVLKAARELAPNAVVILATANGTIESAVDAIKLGAFNYLIKPFSVDSLEAVLEKAQEHLQLIKHNRFYREDAKKGNFIAESPAMKKLSSDLEKIAKSNASVFITGESGTGKEVIASAIHERSLRAEFPFVKVNCAAIPETLIESEFFGHEKGSFTGAHTRKTGRFELADKGTLLLDEVTEIPLMLQPKLLRAIQEQEFERVGGTRAAKVNIRFLATSNRNMQEAIENKIFREDLFYRLNVVPLQIPALRERPEDILPLARYFIAKFCQENHKALKTFTAQAEKKLLEYPWPGNVRELANIIERTVVLDFDEVIDASHLYLDTPIRKQPKSTSLYEMEKQHILAMLDLHANNRTKTASALGISLRTLRNKLHEYGDVSDS